MSTPAKKKPAWAKANPEKAKAYQRAWYLKNKDRVRKNSRAWAAKNPERDRENRRRVMWRLHGLPEPTRPRPELCECCHKPSGKYVLALDHCHETGKFRGWLCSRCNVGIGALGDTVESIECAYLYLLGANHVE